MYMTLCVNYRLCVFTHTPDKSCWLSTTNGVIWAFVGPMLLIIVVSLFILIACIHNVIMYIPWPRTHAVMMK